MPLLFYQANFNNYQVLRMSDVPQIHPLNPLQGDRHCHLSTAADRLKKLLA